MKQIRKRLLALIMAMAMALSLSAPAWAAEESTPDTSVEAVSEVSAETPDDDVVAEPDAEAREAETDSVDEGQPEESSQVETADVQEDGAIDVQDDDDDDEMSIYDVPATPMPDFSDDGDWRLPAGSSDFYLQCAQAVIDGKETPDFDVHFECEGVTIDYIYNGDGTYTLSTAGDMDNGWSEKKFNKKYKNNRGDSSYSRFRRGISKEYNWLRIPANRSTPELQARYDEMTAFYDSVEKISYKFLISKVFCDTTQTVTRKYNTEQKNQKTVTVTYKGFPIVLSPLTRYVYDTDLSEGYAEVNDWHETVEEFTFGPHVKVASGVRSCPNLTKFSWGESKVTEIMDDMFSYTPKIREIRIPATVKQIGYFVYGAKYHAGYAGPDGDFGDGEFDKDRTLVFEGDIVIGNEGVASTSVLNVGIKKITALGNLTLHSCGELRAQTLEFKKNFHVELDPSMNSEYHKKHGTYLIANLFAERITVGGNADFSGCDIDSEWQKSYDDKSNWNQPILSIESRGNMKFGELKPFGPVMFVRRPVKNVKVGGDLFVHEYGPFGEGLDSITVDGKVTQSKTSWEFTVFENYPIKSHGTTTAKEALKKGIQRPTPVSAKSTAKRKIKVKWKLKNHVGTGIEIQYRPSSVTSKWSKRNCKTIKLEGVKKTSVTISKLKSGKKYDIRIRTVGKGGKASTWDWLGDGVKVK